MESALRELYPETEPFLSDHLNTPDGHEIYYEICGNAEGIPVIFLHGGPGSGCNENHRRYFNPDKYKIIIFDQRGCNRSRPRGDIENNTTQLILADLEQLRGQLNIQQWLLFGGSWGSTLALLYAEQFPACVLGMILRGSFLARKEDLNWFVANGVENIFPDDWTEFTRDFPVKDGNTIELISRAVNSPDKRIQLKASIAWAKWAGRVVTSSIFSEYELEIDDEQKLIEDTRIEMHYASNQYFIDENQILKNINSIPNVPIHLVHGRRDLTCLPVSSWLLKRFLPNAKLQFLSDAGHLAGEPSMVDALVKATDSMAESI